ncbi:MAG: hypothetical protein ACREEM_38020 [Blastocatellia bacterium]
MSATTVEKILSEIATLSPREQDEIKCMLRHQARSNGATDENDSEIRKRKPSISGDPAVSLNGASPRLEMRKPEVVKSFLEENDFLIPLIGEASEKLAEYFGAETPQILEVIFHPDDGSTELFLFIQVEPAISNARARLDRFDEDWWLGEMYRSQNKIVISLEFI